MTPCRNLAKFQASARCDSLGEGVKAVRLLGVGEGHPHARCERRVEDHGGALVSGRQVHGGDGTDALAVQDDALGVHAVP